MNIPKELIEQWLQEAPADSDTAISTHIAQRAAEWALSQPVSMEPVLWRGQLESGGYVYARVYFGNAEPLYTAAQLQEARQQGADEWMERAKDAEKCEDAYAKRIDDLEKSNAVLLEALHDLKRQYSEHPDAFWDWTKARAAIAEVKP